MKRRGWQVSASPKVIRREWVNKRTGQIDMVPEGITPGWNFNPGQTRQENLDKLIAGKLKAADPRVAEVARRDLDEYRKRAGR